MIIFNSQHYYTSNQIRLKENTQIIRLHIYLFVKDYLINFCYYYLFINMLNIVKYILAYAAKRRLKVRE